MRLFGLWRKRHKGAAGYGQRGGGGRREATGKKGSGASQNKGGRKGGLTLTPCQTKARAATGKAGGKKGRGDNIKSGGTKARRKTGRGRMTEKQQIPPYFAVQTSEATHCRAKKGTCGRHDATGKKRREGEPKQGTTGKTAFPLHIGGATKRTHPTARTEKRARGQH